MTDASETPVATAAAYGATEDTPLVRDAVRGWRTGRLDRVLDGHFDLIGAGS